MTETVKLLHFLIVSGKNDFKVIKNGKCDVFGVETSINVYTYMYISTNSKLY